jgi:hypothetical protein
VEAEGWNFKTKSKKKRKVSGSSTSSASTTDTELTLVKSRGVPANIAFQEQQSGVSNPLPAASGSQGRGVPLPPSRGSREEGPVTHQLVRASRPNQHRRADETSQVGSKVLASYKPRLEVSATDKTRLPGLKCLSQAEAETRDSRAETQVSLH